MNSKDSSQYNPFLRRAAAQTTTAPQPQTPMPPVNQFTQGNNGVRPFVPGSSPASVAPPATSPFPNAGTGMMPPPVGATPFMPRGATYTAPPPSSMPPSSMPPPSMPPTADTYSSMDATAYQQSQSAMRNRKGVTAAQLYSLSAIGTETTQPVQQSAAEVEKEQKPLDRTNKPVNSTDRISLNRIPHPEEETELRTVDLSADDDYTTTIPFPTHQIRYVDNGNSSLRFLRPTNRVFPHTYYMHNKTHLPCSVFATPFAELGPQEEAIPVIDGRKGLVRCDECLAYMNPHCKFINDGHAYICNICQTENDVPSWYYSTVDSQGMRFDRQERPELSKGTVEYIVGKEFCSRSPQKPIFAFVIDITKNAYTFGILQMVLSSIKACIELLSDNEDAKVGLCIFDTQVHMLSVKNGHIHEVLMTDAEDAYPVLGAPHWLLSPASQAEELDMILAYISNSYNPQVRPPVEYAATFAAAKTAAGALAFTGGHVIVIECTPPMIGLGRVSSNENVTAYGTDDESTLYLSSRDEVVYTETGTACCMSSVCVDFIVACREHVHLAEQASLARLSGGNVYICNDITGPYVNNAFAEIHGYIQNLVLKQHNWDVTMKLRVSNGIKVESACGHCTENDEGEVFVAVLDNHSTIEYTLDLPKYLNEPDVYLQLAVLYTTEFGERRIRLFNQKLPSSDSFSKYYKGIDGYAVMMSLARTAAVQMDSTPLPEVRSNLQDAVEECLLQYRVQCSSTSSTSQLVLPDNGKLLPLLLNGLFKSPLLIYNEAGKRDLLSVMPRGDIRASMISYMTYCDIQQFVTMAYPQLYKLNPAETAWGCELENGFITKPEYLFLTSASLDLSSVYLLSSVRGIVFVVGNQVDPAILKSLFGVESMPNSEYAGQCSLLPEGDDFCNRVNVLVGDLQQRYGCYLQPKIIVRGSPEASQVMELMIEDALRKASSFSDFLAEIHSNIISGV